MHRFIGQKHRKMPLLVDLFPVFAYGASPTINDAWSLQPLVGQLQATCSSFTAGYLKMLRWPLDPAICFD